MSVRYEGEVIRYNLNIPSMKEQKLRNKNRKLSPDLIPGLVDMMNSSDEQSIRLAWKIINNHKVDKTFQKLMDALVSEKYNKGISDWPFWTGEIEFEKWVKCKRWSYEEKDKYSYNRYKIVRDIKK